MEASQSPIKKLGRIELGDFAERIQFLSILNLEIRGVIDDPQFNPLIAKRTNALVNFYQVLGLGPEGKVSPSDLLKSHDFKNIEQVESFIDLIDERLDQRITEIFRVYSETLAPILMWPKTQL
ncbi:hypothetical protein [Corynebacterium tuberculostearicum]|uniref:hypothetical protein n=1 Tax=Corynebacterium tuberculostearicum TaxID=38304 RepID=UPI002648FDD9|nr:hypothetical protein [Corynebacterium tuberculostearicum]WKE60133.1 hypothetical protein KAH61_03090 [Corynebacterium tuberculostearicum]